MVTKQLCSLNPFSKDFRQQCVNGLAKAQLSDAVSGDKKCGFVLSLSAMPSRAGHPLTLAQPGWISPSDLLHMREGDVALSPKHNCSISGILNWEFISRQAVS
jgi:hypothetical protein